MKISFQKVTGGHILEYMALQEEYSLIGVHNLRFVTDSNASQTKLWGNKKKILFTLTITS